MFYTSSKYSMTERLSHDRRKDESVVSYCNTSNLLLTVPTTTFTVEVDDGAGLNGQTVRGQNSLR